MSDSQDDSSGGQRRYNLRGRGNDNDGDAGQGDGRQGDGRQEDGQGDDADNEQNDDLTTILRYLVRTGQVRLMSSRRHLGEAVYVGGGSVVDDEVDDDDEYRSHDNSDNSDPDDDQIDHQPEADPSPDVQNLRSSDFMQVGDFVVMLCLLHLFHETMTEPFYVHCAVYTTYDRTAHNFVFRKFFTIRVAVRFPT